MAGFFQKFTFCRDEGVLAGINFPGRKLEKHPVQRITVLALEQQGTIVENGNDHRRALMFHVFARRFAAIGQTHPVQTQVKQAPLIQLGTLERFFGQMQKIRVALFFHGIL